MEKLIYTHSWGDEMSSGVDNIAFQYKSKEDFVFDILEKYKKHQWIYYGQFKSDYETSSIELFSGVWLTKGQLEYIETNILTLEEWFTNNKQVFTL